MGASRFSKAALHAAALLLVCGCAAEFAARLDDLWFHGVAFWSSPSNDDLFMTDSQGLRRGVPGARYQKWQMNSFGFRGGPMSLTPDADRRRVIVLGASEAFGLYESPHMEFGAQLGELTKDRGLEIVNAALPGMTVSSMRKYWDGWVSKFHPSTVIVYPSAHLYASCEDWSSGGTHDESERAGERLMISDFRLFGRIKNVVTQPDFLIRWRNARRIRDATSAHPATWVYTSPPVSCVTRFQSDLAALIADIHDSGASVTICTQALRASRNPTEEDLHDLESFRVFSPRLPAIVLREFVSTANDAIRKMSGQGVQVVDVDAVIGGDRADFEDLVHFNNRGARAVAETLRDSLTQTAASVRKNPAG